MWILDLHIWLWVWKCSSLWLCWSFWFTICFPDIIVGQVLVSVWRASTVYLCSLTFNIPSELVTKTGTLRYEEDACCHLNIGPERNLGLICEPLGVDSWIAFLDVSMKVLWLCWELLVYIHFGFPIIIIGQVSDLGRFEGVDRSFKWCFLTTGFSSHFKPRVLEHWVIISILKSTIMVLDIFSVQILNPYICTNNIINTI